MTRVTADTSVATTCTEASIGDYWASTAGRMSQGIHNLTEEGERDTLMRMLCVARTSSQAEAIRHLGKVPGVETHATEP